MIVRRREKRVRDCASRFIAFVSILDCLYLIVADGDMQRAGNVDAEAE